MDRTTTSKADGASFENRFYGWLHSRASRDLSILRDYRVHQKSKGSLAADFAVVEKSTNEPVVIFECKALPKEQVEANRKLTEQLNVLETSIAPRDMYLVTEGSEGMFSFWIYDEKESRPVYVGDDIQLNLQGLAAITRETAANRQHLLCSILSWVYAAVCLVLFFVTSFTSFEPSTNSLILLGLCGVFTMAPFLQTFKLRNSFLELEFPSRPPEQQ